MDRKAVTLRQVAGHAGVSTSTASRVLNNKILTVPVTDQTRTKVIEAARMLGYRPNRLARGLITARTNIIGIYLPLYLFLQEHSDNIPTAERMGFAAVGAQIAGVQSVAYGKNYDLHIFQRMSDEDQQRPNPDLCPDFIDGLIYPTPDIGHCLTLRELGLRTVTIEYNPPEFFDEFGWSTVYLDSLEEVYGIVRGWIDRGHTRIGLILFLDHEAKESTYQLAAYNRALDEAGIPYDERLVVEGSPKEGAGKALARRLLLVDPPPTAIFVGRADNAVSVLRGIKEAGRRCPEDVELVVWCNDHAFEATEPQLAALDVPFHLLGMEAAKVLCKEIEGGLSVTRQCVSCRLVERASCRLRSARSRAVPVLSIGERG